MAKTKNKNLLTKDEIIEKIKAEKDYLILNFHLTEIGLFGSYVRGQQKKKSDIDILIDYDHEIGISLFEMMDLSEYLSDIFGKKVDLALKRTLKPVIGHYVLNEVVYI